MSAHTTAQLHPSEAGPGASSALVLTSLYPAFRRGVAVLRSGLVLGRAPADGFTLNGGAVSREHARILRMGPIFVLEDLGSKNGTFLQGRRIKDGRLSPGSVVRLGDWVGVVETQSEPQRASDAIGGCEVLAEVLGPARKIASSDVPVALVGETGTGKEVVARAIHQWSGRAGAFRAVNCGSVPSELAESELFGHCKGAFSGANQARPGLFRAAHRGTLLLDEALDLPPPIQTKLLRVLQEREVTPLGESNPVPVDVRIVVASQKPIADEVRSGRFRQDLWMRLRGLEVTLPPLRERLADLPPLVARFITEYCTGGPVPTLSSGFMEALCLYPWPGNVRELESTCRTLLALHGDAQELVRAMLPPEFAMADEGSVPLSRDEEEARLLRSALDRNDGNVAQACREIGLSRPRAYRLMRAKHWDQDSSSKFPESR